MPIVDNLHQNSGICLVITEDIFLMYLLIPIQKQDQKILLKSFGYAAHVAQMTYQKNTTDLDKKTNIICGI